MANDRPIKPGTQQDIKDLNAVGFIAGAVSFVAAAAAKLIEYNAKNKNA